MKRIIISINRVKSKQIFYSNYFLCDVGNSPKTCIGNRTSSPKKKKKNIAEPTNTLLKKSSRTDNVFVKSFLQNLMIKNAYQCSESLKHLLHFYLLSYLGTGKCHRAVCSLVHESNAYYELKTRNKIWRHLRLASTTSEYCATRSQRYMTRLRGTSELMYIGKYVIGFLTKNLNMFQPWAVCEKG